MAEKIALLIDFDGTASSTDVGGQMFGRYCPEELWDRIDEGYKSGAIGSRMAYRLVENRLNENREAWEKYALDNHQLDPALEELVAGGRKKGWLVEILSDGIDFYIEAMLARSGIEIDTRSARLAQNGDGFTIRTPHMNPQCGMCATCKSDRVGALVGKGYHVIYIGDGVSDICAAPKAHRIFAKDHLAEHLQAEGTAFEEFENLNDVSLALFGQPNGKENI